MLPITGETRLMDNKDDVEGRGEMKKVAEIEPQ